MHGYIIVYSITDRRSYQKAADVLSNIRYQNTTSPGCSRPIILVANKSDLERSRMIGKEGLICGKLLSLTVIMVALWNRADHYIFILSFVLLRLLSSSFFPCPILASADWMSAILPHMVWP